MLPQCPVCSDRRYALVCETHDRLLKNRKQRYQVYQCRTCGLGRTEPFPALEEIPSLYPKTYSGDTLRVVDAYLQGRLTGTSSWRMETEKVQLVESFKTEGRILDVGCAEGKFLWALDPRKWDRTGIELNRQTIELVKERIDQIRYLWGDLESPYLENEFFDVICFWHVLEHLPDPIKAMTKVSRLLKPGGIAVVSVPNLASLQVSLFGKYWYAFDDVPRHLYHLTPESLKRLFLKSGLEFRSQKFFSKAVNFHCWKYSLINWIEDQIGKHSVYYVVKPWLLTMPFLEAITGKPGVFTQIAQKPNLPLREADQNRKV